MMLLGASIGGLTGHLQRGEAEKYNQMVSKVREGERKYELYGKQSQIAKDLGERKSAALRGMGNRMNQILLG